MRSSVTSVCTSQGCAALLCLSFPALREEWGVTHSLERGRSSHLERGLLDSAAAQAEVTQMVQFMQELMVEAVEKGLYRMEKRREKW